ncbi:methyltransferase domain-containing protein [Comamonas sp. F1-6]|uniref:methyltransferase domain-containing protein n=1 Tax=Comamonas sp. F1-6 TaxID=673550 RepID=UPI0031D6A10F
MQENIPNPRASLYYPELLQHAKDSWTQGDWEALIRYNVEDIQNHTERAQLALLIAAGHHSSGNNGRAHYFIQHALQWGGAEAEISKMLLSGVFDTLGRAAIINQQEEIAEEFYKKSINIFYEDKDLELVTHKFRKSKESVNYLLEIERRFHINSKLNFFLKDNYKSRTEYVHYDDMNESDEWQLEVYLYAYGLMKKNGWNSVADIGCGSGYKLINYLGDFHTIGYELDINLPVLFDKYPDRDWRPSNFNMDGDINVDLIVCSDVIEHLTNPDDLIRYFLRQKFEKLILSTPDRDICRGVEDFGPPKNKAHQREWNFLEFYKYISNYFNVTHHAVTNSKQGTQMIVCEKYKNF